MTRDRVVIGGASAMWGDSAIATPQLLTHPTLDYLVYDYLAETTMAILARTRTRSPAAGYASDFVSSALAPNLRDIVHRKVKVISNAGGLNPLACRDAIARVALDQGIDLAVAAVTGDDLTAAVPELRRQGIRTDDGQPLPEMVLSANAYLGARPIVAALERGADIVVTGRCVDSAMVVAPMVYEFGWSWNDFDRLAQATLAGHVIECGAQATGGLFTDWETVPDWDAIGYPIIECDSSGGVTLTKPPGTGGLITPAAVAEQILYEIGDPSSYAMPDVITDVRHVRIEPIDDEHVRLSGARGRAPQRSLKVSATGADGYSVETLLAIRGIGAPAKAQRTADALLRRTRRQMRDAGFEDYAAVLVELLGCESQYGPHARVHDSREVVLRIAARHREAAALEFLRREAPSAGTSMAPGTRGHFGGRAEITPAVRALSFFIDRALVQAYVHLGVDEVPVVETAEPMLNAAREHLPASTDDVRPEPSAHTRAPSGATRRVRLSELVWARSGDKGDTCNVGVIAREPEIYPLLLRTLTAERVAHYFAHLMEGGRADRYELPGLSAMNFVLHRALGGGGMASLRSDPLGKSFAQMLLDLEIEVPPYW